MDLLWYGNWGRPVLAFPTSTGGCGQNEDFGLFRGGLEGKIDAGEVQVCCVDGVDGEAWANDEAHPGWKVWRHTQYDRYLETEVAPFIAAKAQRGDLITYGASLGGYHSVNFACRHPERVSRCIAFSGIYDIHRFLHGYWDDTCYFNCPTAYVPNLPPEWVDRLGHIGFVIATGEPDHRAQANRDFAATLAAKGLNVYAEIWPGVFGHDWPFWREHLARFVP